MINNEQRNYKEQKMMEITWNNEANDLNVRSKDAEPEAPALEGWMLASAIQTEEIPA